MHFGDGHRLRKERLALHAVSISAGGLRIEECSKVPVPLDRHSVRTGRDAKRASRNKKSGRIGFTCREYQSHSRAYFCLSAAIPPGKTVPRACLYQTEHAKHWGFHMAKSHLKLVSPRT